MDNSHYQSSIKRLIKQRNALLLLTLLMSLCVLCLALFLFSKKERLVIVPTEGSSYWIENDQASSAYLHKMGLYLSDLLLNRSPADVDQKNRTILEHTHPSSYHEIRKQLLLEKKSISDQNHSFYFRPAKSYTLPNTTSFVTEGEILIFIGKEGESPTCTQQERRKYTLQFTCANGRILLTSLIKEKSNE